MSFVIRTEGIIISVDLKFNVHTIFKMKNVCRTALSNYYLVNLSALNSLYNLQNTNL